MAKAPKKIIVSPDDELALLLKAALASGEPIVVDTGEAEYPLRIEAAAKAPKPKGKPFTKDDPLWKLVGSVATDPTDVARNKHKYLAEAYADHHTT